MSAWAQAAKSYRDWGKSYEDYQISVCEVFHFDKKEVASEALVDLQYPIIPSS